MSASLISCRQGWTNKAEQHNILCINFIKQRFGLKNQRISAQQKALRVGRNLMTPKVFISYSWDNETHQNWVKTLAEQLVTNGIDVFFDQYDLSIGMEMTHFMEKAVSADKILVILTPNYKLKADKRTGGVGYEYSLITHNYYTSINDKSRIFPILRTGDLQTSFPEFMKTRIYHDMTNDTIFDANLFKLIKQIIGQPLIKKPPLGKLPDFETTTPDVIKTLKDYNAKLEYKNKKIKILQSEKGKEMLLSEVDKIIDQISDSLDIYRKNFNFSLLEKRELSRNITFASSNFTFFIGLVEENLYGPYNRVIRACLYQGIVGFREYGFFPNESKLIYQIFYDYDLNENFEPIFVKSDNDAAKLNSFELASIALREVVTREINYQTKGSR